MVVGDCVRMGGPPDRPEATKAACGTPESNFKVVATVFGTSDGADQCPTDVDSYYSMRGAFSESRNTICLDIDWVVGGCMSIDQENGRDPVRVDCDDASVPGRSGPPRYCRARKTGMPPSTSAPAGWATPTTNATSPCASRTWREPPATPPRNSPPGLGLRTH